MATNNSRGPAGLERVRMGFAAWREGREGGERIPDALWDEAARAARQHGVHRVSRELGLDYNHLKRRAQRCVARRDTSRGVATGFVELDGTRPETGVACLVELEKSNGTRMRLCVRDAATVDWSRMKEAFLGA